jgi:hypothetical protein
MKTTNIALIPIRAYNNKRKIIQCGVFICDKEDEELLNQYDWSVDDKGYPKTNVGKNGKFKTKRAHQIILHTHKGQLCDHKNGDRMDNRKENLRITNYYGNARNRCKVEKKTSSVYKGVSIRPSGRWRAQIQCNVIGTYDTPEQAAEAYNERAKKLFKQFAWLNAL